MNYENDMLSQELSPLQRKALALALRKAKAEGFGFVQIRIVKGVVRFIGHYTEAEFNAYSDPNVLEYYK